MANWALPDNFRLIQNNGNAINLAASGAAVKVMLVTSGTAPTSTSTTVGAAGTPFTEVSGTNYTAGGISITAGMSCTLTSGVVTWKSSTTVTWTQNAGGFTNARYALIYGTSSTYMIAYGDLGSNVGNVAGDLSISGLNTSIFTSP